MRFFGWFRKKKKPAGLQLEDIRDHFKDALPPAYPHAYMAPPESGKAPPAYDPVSYKTFEPSKVEIPSFESVPTPRVDPYKKFLDEQRTEREQVGK